jgi:hypothetical protein
MAVAMAHLTQGKKLNRFADYTKIQISKLESLVVM